MCRHIGYIGEKKTLYSILFEHHHSLIEQIHQKLNVFQDLNQKFIENISVKRGLIKLELQDVEKQRRVLGNIGKAYTPKEKEKQLKQKMKNELDIMGAQHDSRNRRAKAEAESKLSQVSYMMSYAATFLLVTKIHESQRSEKESRRSR